MDESDYWVHREGRVCRELGEMREKHLREFWCDGFVPQLYLIDDPSPRITGDAWICKGDRQEKWDFTLLLGSPVESRDAIPWSAFLPPEDVTRWLTLDFSGRHRHIRIEPGAAVPDPEK